MMFETTPERAALRDSAERYAAASYPADDHLARLGAAAGLDRERWTALAEMGWLAADLPEERGGLGLPFSLLGTVAEALAPGLVPEPLLSQAAITTYLLAAAGPAGDDELEALLRGDSVLGLAHHETIDAAHYATPVASQFRRTGDSIVLDASKVSVIDGALADGFLVSARNAEPPHALALLRVPAGTERLAVSPHRVFDGRTFVDLEARGVHLEPDAVLAIDGDLAHVIDVALDRYGLLLAADTLGMMRSIIDLTAAYLAEREQFGQKIGNFQALQHRLADMQLRLTRAESLIESAVVLIDAAGFSAARRAIAAARIGVEDNAVFVAEQAIQLHGGIGMTDEYILAHYVKRITANRFASGQRAEHALRFAGYA